jgi:hypothetical protein
MEIPERTLIGLKLILEEFNVTIPPQPLFKAFPVDTLDMDHVIAVVALMQLLHPMGYSFKLVHDKNGYQVVSKTLDKHLQVLQKKLGKGDFIITGRRYGISTSCASKIAIVAKYTKPPEPFNQYQWLIFVGMWAALHQCTDDKTVVEIVISDYIDFLPYIDLAEEAVTLIQSQSTRNIA